MHRIYISIRPSFLCLCSPRTFGKISNLTTLQGINISHQTGSSENHRLKMPFYGGYVIRSLEGISLLYLIGNQQFIIGWWSLGMMGILVEGTVDDIFFKWVGSTTNHINHHVQWFVSTVSSGGKEGYQAHGLVGWLVMFIMSRGCPGREVSTLPETNSSHLKMDGGRFISFWDDDLNESNSNTVDGSQKSPKANHRFGMVYLKPLLQEMRFQRPFPQVVSWSRYESPTHCERNGLRMSWEFLCCDDSTTPVLNKTHFLAHVFKKTIEWSVEVFVCVCVYVCKVLFSFIEGFV